MAKTSAERQAAYRAKRAGKDAPERRLNTWISTDTYKVLENLSGSYGVTMKATIELLVANAPRKPAGLAPKSRKQVGASRSSVAGLVRNAGAVKSGGGRATRAEKDEKLARNTSAAGVDGKRVTGARQAEKLRSNETRAARPENVVAAARETTPEPVASTRSAKKKQKQPKKQERQIDLFG